MDYNEEPVHYCTNCLSLNIRPTTLQGRIIDFCGICGGTDIEQTDIDTWEALHVNLYGNYYVKRNKRLGGDQGSGKKPVY
jgi:hypothetical protein